jgi:hypothetical protein
MKLTKKHIGKLLQVNGADGSWCYQLIAVNKNKLLFYSFDGKYVVDSTKHTDFEYFKPLNPFPNSWLRLGWKTAMKA